MNSPVIFIALGAPDPAEQEAYSAYAQNAGPILVAAGGRPKARMRMLEPLAGEAPPLTVMMMEFDDADTVKAALASDAYQALVPLRDRAFSSFSFFLAEDAR